MYLLIDLSTIAGRKVTSPERQVLERNSSQLRAAIIMIAVFGSFALGGQLLRVPHQQDFAILRKEATQK